jgi:tRNA G18 (ribose-2'-O)-methylase SpoU
MEQMPPIRKIPIHSLDDPRVAPYRNLRDRTLRGDDLFISEGELVTHRLLESEYEVDSVFGIERYIERLPSRLLESIPVYVAPRELLRQIVGFPFHRGVLAVGKRPALPSLEEVLEPSDRHMRSFWVVLPKVLLAENLGIILRSAAAMGTDGVLLGPESCDPFSRRVLRLSMGGTLQVPIVRVMDLPAAVETMKRKYRFHLIATTLEKSALRPQEITWPPRTALFFGNEYEGLPDTISRLCEAAVTIPMKPRFDSLNVGVAFGIFLYQWHLATGSWCGGGKEES